MGQAGCLGNGNTRNRCQCLGEGRDQSRDEEVFSLQLPQKVDEQYSASGSTSAPSVGTGAELSTTETITSVSSMEKEHSNAANVRQEALKVPLIEPTPEQINALPARIADGQDTPLSPDNSNGTPSPMGQHDSASRLPETPLEGDQAARSSPTEMAVIADAEATKLMDKCCVLEAEAVLARALRELEGQQETAAAQKIRDSAVFSAVTARLGQYLAVSHILNATAMKLCWEKEGSRLWVNAPSGASWFEFKIATDIDAPLHCCLAYANEVDMMPKYEPMLVGPPEFLGPVLPLLAVTRSLIGLLLFRIELIFEVFKVTNESFGFLAESIRADFPHEGRPIPAKQWRYKRISVDTNNLWIPHGDGKTGTTVIQACKVDLGFRVPESALSYFCKNLAGGMVKNLRTNACRAVQPDSPWQDRIKTDKYGLYAECKKAEAVAARRQAISASTLPSAEIFQRELRILDG